MGEADARTVLLGLRERLRRRWGAAVPEVDVDTLTEAEVDAEVSDAEHRIRAMLEGERSGWRPRRTP